jgi:DNA processing protein
MIDRSRYSVPVLMLALTRFGSVSPRLMERLLQRFRDPYDLLEASESTLTDVQGVTVTAARQVRRAANALDKAQLLNAALLKRQITLSTRLDDLYVHRLFELNDPPSLLYSMGSFPDSATRSVTLVGAAQATTEGIAWSSSLSRGFASEKIQIISSLTGGNDAAIHLACRTAGGRSFAVIDGGFDGLDSVEQVPLALDIAKVGGVISEYPPDAPTQPENLPASDRILAGLGQAVVVTEIYHDSTRVHDLLEFCNQVGKLAMVTVDPVNGPLADKESLIAAVKQGAVILQGPNQLSDIIRSLV